nr:MAG: 5-oxoprolinase [Vulcanisaeta sp. AZ3]
MYSVAVDVGGTFTDFVILNEENGEILTYKVLSTPKEPERGFIEGLNKALTKFGIRPSDVSVIIHATTIGTNLLLGQVNLEIPKTALFTTKGFRDIIEIGRQNRPRLYDIFFEKPKPLVPRDLRFEVSERIDAWGKIIEDLNTDEVEKLAREAKDKGVISVAVALLHSYINPTHELKAKEVLRKYFRYVSISYEVAPEPREYERTSTTVINAVEMPIVSKYIDTLKEWLSTYEKANFYIMASSGGLINPEEAITRPMQLIESGPAAGVVASAELARVLGIDKVISFDMGGTTAKAGTVINYEPEITTEYEVGGEVHHGRVIKGSGYPIRYPFIDLAEVSAGGGTIIWRDEAGALRVGPISAGADPGPICYGRGGKEPTLTDANTALGRLGEYLLGGSMKLDIDGAIKGLAKLGDPIDVALNAIKLATLEMARAIRLVTIERGLDPQEFTLFAFGGAGPQFVAGIADELGIRRVVVPVEPGLFSALGLLMADLKFETRRTVLEPLTDKLEERFEDVENELTRKFPNAYFVRYVDARYAGQGWELTVQVPKPLNAETVRRAFEEKHLLAYGFKLDRPVEVVTIRVFAVIPRRKYKPNAINRCSGNYKPKSYRRVFFDDWVETPIYDRHDLDPCFKAEGPLIIEEYASTTVVPPRWTISMDKYGNLILTRG